MSKVKDSRRVIKQFAVIVGGGFFGTKALMYFARKKYKIIVIDINPKCKSSAYVKKIVEITDNDINVLLKRLDQSPILVIGDAPRIIAKMFHQNIIPAFIVPTAPFHVAARICEEYLKLNKFNVIYEANPVKYLCEVIANKWYIRKSINYGMAVISRIPFTTKCPSTTCKANICPITGRNIDIPLHSELEECLEKLTNLGYINDYIVIKSILLNSEIGCISPLPLLLFLSRIKKNTIIAIATSGKCHGVVNFFRIN